MAKFTISAEPQPVVTVTAESDGYVLVEVVSKTIEVIGGVPGEGGGGDMYLDQAQLVTGKKTFSRTAIAIKGVGTGVSNITTANTSATSYTATLPAKEGTVAMLDDITTATSGIMKTGEVQTVIGTKTFDSQKIAIKGSRDGVTTLSTENGTDANFIATLQAKTGKVAMLDDITDAQITISDSTNNNAGTAKHGFAPKATAPAANALNVVGITNGEPVYTNKALLDTTTPSTQNYGDTASAGTSLKAAHVDHKHAMPAAPTTVTGSAGSIKSNATSGLMQITGPAAGTTRVKTVSDGDDTLMELGQPQSVTGVKTFNPGSFKVKGTSTGVNTIEAANTSATSYTNTVPAKSGTFAMTDDITGTNSGTNTGDETATRVATIINAVAAKTTMVDADKVTIIDTEASNALKTLSWSYVKSILKTYFDTLYMVLASVQSVTGLKTFDKDKIAMKGTSTGTTTISTANISATNYTQVLPAKDGTFAMTSDITAGSGDMVLDSAQFVTGLKTFDNEKLAMIGSDTGRIYIATANNTATNYTQTLPAKTGTFAMLSDVTAAAGDVTGPSSATNNHVVVFDGTTGKLIKSSGVAYTNFVGLTGEGNVVLAKGGGSSTVAGAVNLGSTPGTTSSPTATVVDDMLGEVRFFGRKATAYSGTASSIKGVAEENFTDSATGSRLILSTTQKGGTTLTERVRVNDVGNTGFGVTAPTGVIHLKAGTTSAGTAPLKLTAGTNMTNAEAGAVEWDGTNLFATQTSGPTRKTIAYTTDITDATISLSDVTTNNAGTSNHGWAPKATAPASNALSVVGITNGETLYSNKALLDTTTPSTQNYGDAASAGTSLKAAHVDHKHAMPAAPTTVTGSAGSVKSNSTTGVMQITGPTAGTTRVKTVSDGNDTIVEVAAVQSITGAKTFDSSTLKVKGSSTGVTTIASATADGSNYTQTLPAKTGTFAMTSDITGTNSGTNTGDETATRVATIINAVAAKTTMADADKVTIIDTEASNSLKTLSWSYVKSILKTYFDTLYGVGDMVLSAAQSITGAKTFDSSALKMKGSSTGVTTVASANASATNYTLTMPAETATLDTRTIQVTTITVAATGWTTDGSLKKYQISDSNITANSVVEVIPDNSTIDYVTAAQVLPATSSEAGKVNIWAKTTPTNDFGVTINIKTKA